MRGRREERIESAIDQTAAAVFAVAIAFSVFMTMRGALPLWQFAIAVFACSALGYAGSASLLGRISVAGREIAYMFDLQAFAPEQQEELMLSEQVELVLTDADIFRPGDELILGDILAELGPESRVVRLFDRAAMPTPAQLNDRIERHLRGAPPGGVRPHEPADASEALHEALAELRRSLG